MKQNQTDFHSLQNLLMNKVSSETLDSNNQCLSPQLRNNSDKYNYNRVVQQSLPRLHQSNKIPIAQHQRLLRPKTSKKRLLNLQEVTIKPQIGNTLLLSQSQPIFNQIRTNKIRIQLIEQNINLNQNNAQTLISLCFHCKEKISTHLYILPCSHQFHADCLKLLMNNQIDQQLGIIRCKCGKEIPQKTCVGLLSPFYLKIYFQIQAQHLPKLNQGQRKWKKCTNHGCDFIFIENPSIHLNGKQSKCPNCIEQILGQTMLFPKI